MTDQKPVLASELLLTLSITDLSRGGAGVARDSEGRVIFVPHTAPGDLVRARVTSQSKRYAEGELVEIIQSSPVRVRPRCPVFGECGGCQWQHLPYELQWKTKMGGVIHALMRAGVNVPAPEAFDEMPADQIWGYRNRIQLRGYRDQIGYFGRGGQTLVPIDRCDIARVEINQVLKSIREEGAQLSRPYKVEVEVLPSGEIRKAWNSRHAAFGFRQIHDQQNEKLRSWIHRVLTPGRILLDLFGGSGNLSSPSAIAMKRVYCVDVNATDPICRSPVVPWLKKAAAGKVSGLENSEETISAILDPPRDGLANDFRVIAGALERLRVGEIVAVGCDPDAWARDVSRFQRSGWTLTRVGAVDLFPQTSHVESLALLRRENA